MDDNGESHFEDLIIELSEAGQIGRLSREFPVNKIIFRENDSDYNYDWHPAPKSHYIISLDGEIELQVSDEK